MNYKRIMNSEHKVGNLIWISAWLILEGFNKNFDNIKMFILYNYNYFRLYFGLFCFFFFFVIGAWKEIAAKAQTLFVFLIFVQILFCFCYSNSTVKYVKSRHHNIFDSHRRCSRRWYVTLYWELSLKVNVTRTR